MDSPIFGKGADPTPDQREQIKELVREFPVCAFQMLNEKFNERGLCISIATLEESR